MSFKTLYEWSQKQTSHIKRTAIQTQVQSLTNQKIEVCWDNLDIRILRGFWLNPPKAAASKFHAVNKSGGPVVVIARDLNRCWKRFITVKELMHALDATDEHTSTAEQFEEVIDSLSSGVVNPTNLSPQMRAEHVAVYKALAVLCTQKNIAMYSEQYKKGGISYYDIALSFGIPEQYVPIILGSYFEATVTKILLKN